MTLFCVIMDKDIIHWICEFVTSLGFPNLAFEIAFALTYTSVLKGRPSTRALIFGITNSFKYENFLTVVMSARSISMSNWFQNLHQSKFSNLLMINFGSFTFTGFSLAFLSLLISAFFSKACLTLNFVVSNFLSSLYLRYRRSSSSWSTSAFLSRLSLCFNSIILF